MQFTLRGFLKGIIIAGLLCMAVFLGLRHFGYIGRPENDDPISLAREAREALAAVRARRPGQSRPPSYDMVLAPLDKLLAQARELVQSGSFNPVTDYDLVVRLTAPVMEVARLADAQAKLETGYLTKEYRFNDQFGEASLYLATTLWERINALQPKNLGYLDDPVPLPENDMKRLRDILDAGINAAPDSRDLHYLRGIVNRADGLFAPAAKDLERAVEIDSSYAAAWNTLGLVRIPLREFDKAEEALERARALALLEAEKFKVEPGEEYTAIVYNLASFHEGLAAFYERESRLNPTVENQRLLKKHAADARKHLEEFLSREPSGTPDAREARAKLDALP